MEVGSKELWRWTPKSYGGGLQRATQVGSKELIKHRIWDDKSVKYSSLKSATSSPPVTTLGIQQKPEIFGRKCVRSRGPERLLGRPDMFFIRRANRYSRFFSCSGYVDCPLKSLQVCGKSWREQPKNIYSLQLFSDGTRGASDHWKDFRNEQLRWFTIGAMLLFSLRVGLSEKLSSLEILKVGSKTSKFFRSQNFSCS